MTTTTPQKNSPDPSIKKNIARARQKARSGKRGTGFVVAASLAATLMSWALFSHEDAQRLAAAQATSPAPIVAAATVQRTGTAQAQSVMPAFTAVPIASAR